MGLKLKPRKCKSLSIRSGKSENIGFKLGDAYLGSLLGETFHKFLGAFYTFENLGGEVASLVLSKFRTGLENIDGLLVRDELKVRIYAEYFLNSNRFVFFCTRSNDDSIV